MACRLPMWVEGRTQAGRVNGSNRLVPPYDKTGEVAVNPDDLLVLGWAVNAALGDTPPSWMLGSEAQWDYWSDLREDRRIAHLSGGYLYPLDEANAYAEHGWTQPDTQPADAHEYSLYAVQLKP